MANGKSLKSFKILLVVILFAAYQNSIFDILKEYNVLIERVKDTITNIQENQNTYAVNPNISEPIIGAKNNTFEDMKDVIGDEKLLGGLLISSFDEASCISRFQSYMYRKASPYKPSKYLISKLRNYEHLHQRCGPYTKSYNETMKNGTKDSKNDADLIKCKYLVWTASDGLGNRMITLVSAFLYAILTDRVLLVRFDVDMLNLFCEPFSNSSWLLPKNSPFWDLKQFETREIISMNNKENNSREFPPSALVLNLRHTNNRPTNLFHCDQNQDLLQKVPMLILQSNQYFVPSLFMISSFRQELHEMFPDKDTVFHHVGRYLFHPSNEVWEQIRKLYETHLAKENERIGLQIRVFNSHEVPQETIMNEIISCVHESKLLPKLNMQSSVSPRLKNDTSKVVVVVSLYSNYAEELKSLYQNNKSWSREVIKVYQPSHEEHQHSGDNMHNIKAWTEIYLLGLCDALVTSPSSTFGYVANSLGGLKPWILRDLREKIVPNEPCQQISLEPCFHDPPKYDCRTKTLIDHTSVFHDMKHCEDRSRGIKITNMYD